MIRRSKIVFFSVAVIGFVMWNISWPTYQAIRMRRSRVVHSQEYCGEFCGVYDTEIIIGPEGNYVNTPFTRMPLERSQVKVSVSPQSIVVETSWGGKYGFTETYKLGQDVFYLGDNRFVFYSTFLNFGQIMPGTIYSTTECRVDISKDKLFVYAVEEQIGMGFFLVPGSQKKTFTKTFPSI